MSQCDPNDPCELCRSAAPVVREKVSLKNRCERKQLYKTDGQGNEIFVICDRRRGHNGKHRGRVKCAETTEKLYF